MREPHARWSSIPVYVHELDKEFSREFARETIYPTDWSSSITVILAPEWDSLPEWHDRQAKEAVDTAISAYPVGLSIIPTDSFYVDVSRRWLPGMTFKGNDEAPEPKSTAVSSIGVFEDVSKMDINRRSRLENKVYEVSNFAGIDTLGSNFNPYTGLFARLVAKLPGAWSEWVKRRRLKRWKPEAEWLVKLRLEDRKRRRLRV